MRDNLYPVAKAMMADRSSLLCEEVRFSRRHPLYSTQRRRNKLKLTIQRTVDRLDARVGVVDDISRTFEGNTRHDEEALYML